MMSVNGRKGGLIADRIKGALFGAIIADSLSFPSEHEHVMRIFMY